MNEEPRKKLAELIARYGRGLCDDPRRTEALLRDVCGEHRREVSVLIAALRERIAPDLLASSPTLPKMVLLGRLTTRLEDDLGLAPEPARWAVESWALALGAVTPADLGSARPTARARQRATEVRPASKADDTQTTTDSRSSGGAPIVATPTRIPPNPRPGSGTVSTVAGANQKGYADGPASVARFANPWGIAVDRRGVLYVTDKGNRRVRSIMPDGTVATVAGSGRGWWGGAGDGPVATASFRFPQAIAIDSQDIIYVTQGTGSIRRIKPDGMVDSIAAWSDLAGSNLQGLAVAPDGTIYASYARLSGERGVCKWRPGADPVQFGGDGGYADGTTDTARFRLPLGLALDTAGNLYIADAENHRIRRLGTDGRVTTTAGTGKTSDWTGRGAYADGPATQACFNMPMDVAVDALGRIHVADAWNNRIRRIESDGTVVTIAGSGDPGYLDGPALNAQFNGPRSLAIGPDGTIYVVDDNNHCIRAIRP